MAPPLRLLALAALVSCQPRTLEAPPSATWLSLWAGPNSEDVSRIAVAADGSTLALGTAESAAHVTTTLAPPASGDTPAAAGSGGQWLAKFGPHGERVFVVGLKEGRWASGVAPTLDGGAVVVATTHGPLHSQTRNDLDIQVTRHDATGQPVWQHDLGGAGSQEFGAVAALPGGGHVIAAEVRGETLFTGDPTVGLTPRPRDTMQLRTTALVARVADDARLAWFGHVDGEGSTTPTALTTGADGTVVLAGECHRGTEASGVGEAAAFFCAPGIAAGFLAVWSAEGVVRWARPIPDPGKGQSTPMGAAILDDGDIVVVGGFRNNIGGDGLPLLESQALRDGFVARFGGADGAPRWIRHLRGLADEHASRAAPAQGGQVWVLAAIADQTELGDGETYEPIGRCDEPHGVLIRFDRDGARTHLEVVGDATPAAASSLCNPSLVTYDLAAGPGDVLRLAGEFRGALRVWKQPGEPLDITAPRERDGFIIARPAPR